ncbi:MAG: ferrous iron transport protein B [Spirochaetia bacterium]|nr:ferrous iron transport protein B [Spirochaetia bacterium]
MEAKFYKKTVYLVGNANVGKSVIFSALTKKYVTISNYPGTTVEVTRGELSGDSIEIIDTPGIASLTPLSEDEQVTRDILLEHETIRQQKPEVILVIDAKNLRRGLVIASQLSFCKIPFFIVLNMMDEAAAEGVQINIKELKKRLGTEIVEAIAIQKEGISKIIELIKKPFSASKFIPDFLPDIELCLKKLSAKINSLIAISIACLDKSAAAFLDKEELIFAEKEIAKHNVSLYQFQNAWHRSVIDLLEDIYQKISVSKVSWLTKLGHLSVKPVAGIFILITVLLSVYKFVGYFGAIIFVDFLENTVFNGYINPFFTKIFDFLPLPEIFIEAFVGKYGILTMGLTYAIAIILPIVTTFFLAFSFLEDSGYFPRMGSFLNNSFRKMGLNGKAVLPMVLGLGCDTMATMTTRILNSRKERIIATLLLALGIPCSAQLGVIFSLGSKLPAGYMAAWGLIVTAVLMFVGYLSSKVIKGKVSLFFMELPPLRVPQFSNLLKKTYMRSKWYLKEAAPLFILGSFILFLMDKFKILEILNKALRPITVYGLNLPEESAYSFILGFLRRDFGAAGFLKLHADGLMTNAQTLTALVVITLFIPCIANFLMIIKERGPITAFAMFFFIVPFAFFIGVLLSKALLILNL